MQKASIPQLMLSARAMQQATEIINAAFPQQDEFAQGKIIHDHLEEQVGSYARVVDVVHEGPVFRFRVFLDLDEVARADDRRLDHGVHVEQGLALQTRVVAGALGAVGAVLGAGAGFDGKQCAHLHLVWVKILSMQGLGPEQQVIERQCEQGLHLLAGRWQRLEGERRAAAKRAALGVDEPE